MSLIGVKSARRPNYFHPISKLVSWLMERTEIETEISGILFLAKAWKQETWFEV